MPEPFYFISYSRVDGEDFAFKLGDQLAAGPPSIGVWLDQRRLQPSIDYDDQLVKALGGCVGFLYVMTKDSVSPNSECKKEWTRALKYKKPIIPLRVHRDVELPYGLEPRQYVDFSHGFDAGLARLREHLRWRETAEGVLHTLKERLNDARRDLARADTAEKARIEDEIAELERQIDLQDLKAEVKQQGSDIEAIRVALRGIVTRFEIDYLRKLGGAAPWLCQYDPDTCDRLKRLDDMRFVRPTVIDGDCKLVRIQERFGDVNIPVRQREWFNMTDYVEITEDGKKYVKLYDAWIKDA